MKILLNILWNCQTPNCLVFNLVIGFPISTDCLFSCCAYFINSWKSYYLLSFLVLKFNYCISVLFQASLTDVVVMTKHFSQIKFSTSVQFLASLVFSRYWWSVNERCIFHDCMFTNYSMLWTFQTLFLCLFIGTTLSWSAARRMRPCRSSVR